MNNFGYFKVAAAIPSVKVADCHYNTERIISLMQQATERGVKVLLLPELSITAATCGDLFLQPQLLHAAKQGLEQIIQASEDLNITVVVGLPVECGAMVYNCAAVVSAGEILGLVPKRQLVNHAGVAESRWFKASADKDFVQCVDNIAGQTVCMSNDMLFDVEGLRFGIEVGSDAFATTPPSLEMAECGAHLILNPASQAEMVGLMDNQRELLRQRSITSSVAYMRVSSGFGESTTDLVYGGGGWIMERGEVLAQAQRFSLEEQLIVADVDVELLTHSRRKNSAFSASFAEDRYSLVTVKDIADNEQEVVVDREFDAMPFIPKPEKLEQRCQEIFSIQTMGLAKRLAHTYSKSAVIGISGGLDSTLALLVTVGAFDMLGLDRKGILGVTMPGFGTSDRTYNNAVTLIKELGVTFKEIPIAAACRQHFADIGITEDDRTVAYENSQARERTQILMDLANVVGGMVIGTGDLSELALGWATYNGDQMSMYSVNCTIPKTLMRYMVRWAAEKADKQVVRQALIDVVQTPVSPELLPTNDEGKIAQKTEDLVGPYELHDFFLYHFLRNGFTPDKILFMAQRAFVDRYDRPTILKWLKTFFRRFFTQQFKRSASPDGVKVGSVGLSPRGDWQMPSDASAAIWLKACEELN